MPSLITKVLTALLAAWVALPAHAAQPVWMARAERVVDGDTLWVQREDSGKRVKLRLQGIDAPESCQHGGAQAQRALWQLVRGQRLQVRQRARDRYRRIVAQVQRAGDGLDVGRRMVEEGWAWNYGRGRRSGYAREQTAARRARRGIFADPGVLQPSEFRRRHGACGVGGGIDKHPPRYTIN